jgi:hypothetical protein
LGEIHLDPCGPKRAQRGRVLDRFDAHVAVPGGHRDLPMSVR